MNDFRNHLNKARLNYLRMKFKLLIYQEHIDKDGEYQSEKKPEFQEWELKFENYFFDNKRDSELGFLNSEILEAENYLTSIGTNNKYYFDLLTEWIAFLNDKKVNPFKMTLRIKALFQFVDFLHLNIKNFRKYDFEIIELKKKCAEINILNPKSNVKDDIACKNLKVEIADLLKVIQDKIINVIEAKADELKVHDRNRPATFLDWNLDAVHHQIRNYNENDFALIAECEIKFLEFKKETNIQDYPQMLFLSLNIVLNQLFDFFNTLPSGEKRYKNLLDGMGDSEALPFEQNEIKTYSAKFYALYHCLKIEMGTAKLFEKNDQDKYNKSVIETYAKTNYTSCSAQGFYRSFKDLDIINRVAIANSFGKGYKEKLIAISDNDSKLISHLKNYPN